MSKASQALSSIAFTMHQRVKPLALSRCEDANIDILGVLVDRDEPKPVSHLHPLKAFGKCPVCNESVHLRHHRQFCGECGNRLVWGVSKNE